MIDSLKSILSDIKGDRENLTFLDPFSGSGVVSRVAKHLSMNVIANDTEYFSYIVNSVYLTLHKEDLASMFSYMGGIDAYFSYLNMNGLYASNNGNIGGKAFLSQHYAPKETHHIEKGKERLFYTRENALFLDGVRNDIASSYIEGRLTLDEKHLLIASVLYQAMRSANISGTFTSYHKQIVGKSSSVKKRVSDDITLLIPYLLNKTSSFSKVYQQDALEFVTQQKGDIVYIDPPSHVQQYSSAYHLLNSIALWDDFAPSEELDNGGYLKDISGIRSDWKDTKSPFCSLKESYKAMVTLMNRIDAPHIILSYPSDGILSVEELHEILSLRNSSVKSISIAKVKKGGKPSLDKKGVSENLFILGKGINFSLLLPQGVEIATKIGRIDSFKESIFTPINDSLEGFTFMKGILIDTSPSYKLLSTYSEKELEKIGNILEKHQIKDSFLAIQQILDTYTSHFSSLTHIEKVKLEKRCISLFRYVKGYEKERVEDIFSLFSSFLSIYEQEMSTREHFVQEVNNIRERYSG